MVNRVFVDANVILDFILKREKFESAKILFELGERNKIKLFISSSILHIIAHWLIKKLGSDITKSTMLYLLEHIKVIEGSHDCSVKALESKFNDIEDALQYYIALQNNMNFIISFDKGFQKYSSTKLPIINVDDFLEII
ncbi:MAG: PIN domain-containing protein [Pelobium sp.]